MAENLYPCHKWDPIFKWFTYRHAVSNKLKSVKYPAAQFDQLNTKDPRICCFIQRLNDGSCFGIAVGERWNSSVTELAYYASCCKNAEELKTTFQTKITAAITAGYDALLESHKQ